VTAAVETAPGAQHAGLTVVTARREVVTPAATGDVVREVDRAQYETGQGPCLDAVFERRTVQQVAPFVGASASRAFARY
jgi:hypothetical protein